MAKQRRHDRTRLILGLELAVVLPAAALVILSALHLMSIQRDRGVEAAIQRDFTQVLQVSEKQFNQRAYDLMDDVRADFPAPGEACAITLDRVLAAHSYVGHVFVYGPDAGLIVRSQPSSLKDAGFRDEAADFNHMMDNWMKMQYKETVDEISTMHVQRKGCHLLFLSQLSAPRRETPLSVGSLVSDQRRFRPYPGRWRHCLRRRLPAPAVFPRDAGHGHEPQSHRGPHRQGTPPS